MVGLVKDIISPWRAYFAEFLGTFVFVFVASGAVLVNIFYGDIGTLGVALATGFSLSTMIYATYHISGGHLNPAVTVSLWLTQKITGTMAFFYICAQILGSFAAGFAILFIYGAKSLEFSLGAPRVGTSDQIAMIAEVLLTAMLTFVVFATLVDRRSHLAFGPLAVGFFVVFATIAAGQISGAVLNPARVLGPMILSNNYDSLAVFLAGPLCGGLFGVVYEWVFLRKIKK